MTTTVPPAPGSPGNADESAPGAVPKPPVPDAPVPPSVPPPPAQRSRRRIWLPLTGALTAAALALGGWYAVASTSGGTATPASHPAPQMYAPGNNRSTAEAKQVTQAKALTTALTAAVRNGDRSAFLALIDPRQHKFRHRMATLFARIQRLPVRSWTYSYDNIGPSLLPSRAARLPKGSRIIQVSLHYRLVGTGSRIKRIRSLTVVPHGDGLLLAGDHDAATTVPESRFVDLWDLEAVHVVRGSHSLVIGTPAKANLRAFATYADKAVSQVDDVWHGKWSRRIVVIVPGSQRELERLLQAPRNSMRNVGAVTSGNAQAGILDKGGDRVMINPKAWKRTPSYGRQEELTHEVTHLATRATSTGAPIWLSEGLAEYVGMKPFRVPASVVAPMVRKAVIAGRAPRHFATQYNFDNQRARRFAMAYESSYLACRMIAEHYGEPRLLKLYRLMSAHPGSLDDSRDMHRALGVSKKHLEAEWRSYMAALA
jgi:hypothetical protein